MATPAAPEIIPDFLWLVLYLFALYIFGRISTALRAGAMVGQIVAGVLFMGTETRLLRGEDLFVVLGWVGLGILVFEGGASLDMNLLRKVAIRATLLAHIGAALPIAFSIIYFYLILQTRLFESVAAGAALASTSIAVALVLMQQHNIAETRTGTLLTAAAMIDDIVSLVLVAVVTKLGASDSSRVPTVPEASPPLSYAPSTNVSSNSLAVAVLRPLAASICVLIVGLITARVMQTALHRLWSKVGGDDEKDDIKHSQRRQRCGWCRLRWASLLNTGEAKYTVFTAFMCFYAFCWCIASAMAGASYLLGAFVAGLAFSSAPGAVVQTQGFVMSRRALDTLEPIKQFLVSLFFGSIGFSLPVSKLFDGWALLYGALLYTIVMILAKFVTGFLAKPFTKSSFLMIGTAMIGRGELGLYLAEQSYRNNTIDGRVYAAASWAIVLNTLVSPILFNLLMKKFPLNEEASLPDRGHDVDPNLVQVDTGDDHE